MLTSLLLCIAPLAQSQTPPTVQEEPARALDRVILIGASVTDGFGLPRELEVPVSLATFFDAAVRVPHGEIVEVGTNMLFDKPLQYGERMVEEARAASPSLVVGVDFPFWFGYGAIRNTEDRLRLLERGLKLLERFECPVIVGDFPDMRAAAGIEVPYLGGMIMLHHSQVPSPQELELLNARLREWVESRENVYLFEMSRFVRELYTDSRLEIRGNVIDPKVKSELLQVDKLHTTAKGTALLTVLVFDALNRASVVEKGDVEWNVEKLEQAVWKATEAEREKRREKARKREERKREREAKKKKEEEQGGGDGEERGGKSAAA